MINIWIINGVGDDHHEPNHPGIQCKLWKQYLWKKVYFASLGFKPETFSFPGIETFYQWLHFLLLKMNYMLKEMLTMMLKMMLGFELKLMMRFRCMLACCRCCQWNLGRSKTFKDIFLKSKWFSFYCQLTPQKRHTFHLNWGRQENLSGTPVMMSLWYSFESQVVACAMWRGGHLVFCGW